MVKFIEVEPESVPNLRESRRGRVSYPILKSFLEINKPLVQLDRTGMQQSMQSLYSSLNAYIRNHNLPIKLFSRGGQLYLMRLDLDDEGNPVDWEPGQEEKVTGGEPINSETVAERFKEEKDKTTK